jgi:hypothetical protein
MRRHALVIMVAALLMSGAAAGPAAGQLRIGQPAPEVTGERWVNSDPLTIERLRGRVVLVEFWTYG